MRAPISVIIPTLNAAGALPGCLGALIEGLDAGVIRELVVSDGGSEDASVAVAEAAGARLVTGAPGRGGQLRRGVEAAGGDWLLLLHADTELAVGWPDAMSRHMRLFPECAGYGRLAFRAKGAAPRLVAGWANVRSAVFGMPYGDQGLLVSRSLLDDLGGVPDLPLMEDVALARALKGRLQALDVTARTSAERYVAEGWVRRGARNLATLARYRLGADPHRLSAGYMRTRR